MSNRRSGLGRGLGSLIPGEAQPTDSVPTDSTSDAYRELPVDAIQPNRFQPRTTFDQESIDELAASVAEVGVLQPILVRGIAVDSYELIAGERRWRAAQKAGLSTIPALVRDIGEQDLLEHAIVENLHRSDLNPLEEAAGYQHLMDEFELTQDAVASRVGKSRSAIANLLRLFQLPAEVQGLLADREISAGHGRALLGLQKGEEQLAMARLAVREGLSVRELERRVKGDEVPASKPASKPRSGGKSSSAEKPAALLELERLLEDHLQTRVEVTMGSGKGRMVVDFADLDDLERVYLRMVSANETAK